MHLSGRESPSDLGMYGVGGGGWWWCEGKGLRGDKDDFPGLSDRVEGETVAQWGRLGESRVTSLYGGP